MPDEKRIPIHLLPRIDVTKEVNALYDHTKDLPRGSVIPHDTVEEITGTQRYLVEVKDGKPHIRENPIYSKIIKKWKNEMTDVKGIFPVSSYGVGYKLPTVKEQQQNIPDSYEKRSQRALKRAQVAVRSIHHNELDEFQKAFGLERDRQCGESLEAGRRHQRERKCFLATPDSLPRRKTE